MAEKQMSNSFRMELAIQRELGYRRKVPCPKKEVVMTLTRSPSFQDWTNTGLISAASAQGYLALHKDPSSPKVQSPRPQNPMGLKTIKDEPYSGPNIPISALKDIVGHGKLPKKNICTNNSSHEGPPLVPGPKPNPIRETNTARFQPQTRSPFPSVPTKLRSGLKRKGEENEQSRTSKKSVDSLVCELCQASCSSALAMQQHLNGRPHKAKLEWYKLQRDRGGPGTNKPMCNICQIWCSDRDALEMHFKGQRHKSKVQELEACKRNGGAVVDKKPILCEMCGVHCMNEDLFKMHLRGKQHALKSRGVSW